jgi:hypothetical protein
MIAEVFLLVSLFKKRRTKAVSSLFKLQQQQKNTIADFVVVVAIQI